MAHLSVTVTRWAQDGQALQSVEVPARPAHLAPWLYLPADVYAVTVESSHAGGRGLIRLREGWAPPSLSPLWERWLDVELEVLDKHGT
jgi:hypothetical protein